MVHKLKTEIHFSYKGLAENTHLKMIYYNYEDHGCTYNVLIPCKTAIDEYKFGKIVLALATCKCISERQKF